MTGHRKTKGWRFQNCRRANLKVAKKGLTDGSERIDGRRRWEQWAAASRRGHKKDGPFGGPSAMGCAPKRLLWEFAP